MYNDIIMHFSYCVQVKFQSDLGHQGSIGGIGGRVYLLCNRMS